ncbi:MAG: hypothetical protein PHC92_04925 [Syntrophomonadaceae bacterium]|nr:hypothetical protein [Syntrophomonadaceae bacterium]
MRNFQTKYINNLVGEKLSGNFEQLLYAFNCPNVALAVENGTISGNDILLYRDKMIVGL